MSPCNHGLTVHKIQQDSSCRTEHHTQIRTWPWCSWWRFSFPVGHSLRDHQGPEDHHVHWHQLTSPPLLKTITSMYRPSPPSTPADLPSTSLLQNITSIYTSLPAHQSSISSFPEQFNLHLNLTRRTFLTNQGEIHGDCTKTDNPQWEAWSQQKPV
jgi:hypothetical protein